MGIHILFYVLYIEIRLFGSKLEGSLAEDSLTQNNFLLEKEATQQLCKH